MYTLDDFTSRWKQLHHPTMNVEGDVAFFHQLYVRLYNIVGRETRRFDNNGILPFLLYIENTVAVGLDGVTNTGTAAWAMWRAAGAKGVA